MAIEIPAVAWSHPLGVGVARPPRPRVTSPMIDDGPWAGVPIGGIGAGSIGRTQRGDFARRHLRIGEHRFGASPVDGFALWASDGTTGGAQLLRSTPGPPGWGPSLAPGAGTYHALFPRSWFRYDTGALPVRVTEEQLAPVIPGDDASASLPVGVFEIELENPGTTPVEASVLFAWDDDLAAVLDAPQSGPRGRSFATPGAAGFVFDHSYADDPGSLAVAVASTPDAEIAIAPAFEASAAPQVWRSFAASGRLPSDGLAEGSSAAVVARVRIGARETRALRFALAWDVPYARFGSGRRFRRRYTREWGVRGSRAVELATMALGCCDDWRRRIEDWQRPVLVAADRPDWYKAALFNELYYLVDGGSLWPDVPPDGPAVTPDIPPNDGHLPGTSLAELGVLECYDYPFYDTLDVHFYAAFALTALWPRLQASISLAYAASVAVDDPSVVRIEATGRRAVRKIPGALPHDLGGPAEDPLVRVNWYAFQEVNAWKDLNPKFVLQAWRDRSFAEDPDDYVRAVWPAVVAAMAHVAAFDRDGDGLPEHDGIPDQTYDTWPMQGPSAYGGSLWLAALRAASAFARLVGDPGRAEGWDADFAHAARSFEKRLWNGRSYDYDDGGGPSSDSIMADQLVGQWYADVCGLGDLVPPHHVRSALERIYQLNVVDFGDGLLGAVNGMRPDGRVDRSSEQSQEVWVGTTYALAAFMIGRGMVEEGWTTAAGAARVTYERGLWFRTPEAYDRSGDFRASMYLRPLAIWAIEEALARRSAMSASS